MLSNYGSYIFGTRSKDLTYWNFGSSGALIGVSLFSFESISLIINGKYGLYLTLCSEKNY